MKTAKSIMALLGVLLLAVSAVAQPFPIPTTQPTTRPVGVWYQPASSFQKWKQRGVNRLIGFENEGGSVSPDAWCAAAKAGGFTYILQPGVAQSHWNDRECVAVQYLPDEPIGKQTAGQVLDGCLAIHKQTGKPVWVNFDGWGLQWLDDATIAAYCAGADWIGMDWYLANHGEGLKSLDGWTATIARLRRLAPGKKIICFIECCDQNLRVQSWAQTPIPPQTTPWALNMHGPTILEMKTQHDMARAWDCEIAWFPDKIGLGWENFDNIVDTNAGAMIDLNLNRQ